MPPSYLKLMDLLVSFDVTLVAVLFSFGNNCIFYWFDLSSYTVLRCGALDLSKMFVP